MPLINTDTANLKASAEKLRNSTNLLYDTHHLQGGCTNPLTEPLIDMQHQAIATLSETLLIMIDEFDKAVNVANRLQHSIDTAGIMKDDGFLNN